MKREWKRVSKERIARIVALRDGGLSWSGVGKQVGMEKGNVSRIYRRIKGIKGVGIGEVVDVSVEDKEEVLHLAKGMREREIIKLEEQIAIVDKAVTQEKADSAPFQALVISKGVLIDKRNLMRGMPTERISVEDVRSMPTYQLIQIINAPLRPEEKEIIDVENRKGLPGGEGGGEAGSAGGGIPAVGGEVVDVQAELDTEVIPPESKA